MLFNSLTFILLFLPVTYLLYNRLRQGGSVRGAQGLLIGASLFYYGWQQPAFLVILFFSILVNYGIGRALHQNFRHPKLLLISGISFNLVLLCFFKYWVFIIHNINIIAGAAFPVPVIVLPLGISFYTFQQIAYLVDTSRGNTSRCDFFDYVLFISFFPHVFSGPIVRFHETMPQLTDTRKNRLSNENLSVGMTMFVFGLFKKVVIADNIGLYVNPVFEAAAQGASVSFFEAWGGAMAYSFKIYFDFSGYSDMAIGVARMFGIYLPLNFNSPFKALNIVDFWRRWHITLIRFLRDYLYIPLGGNKKGTFRRSTNIMVTMLLAGIWHGSGWTFAVWGALHGLMITVTHFWQVGKQAAGWNARPSWFAGRQIAQIATFLSFVATMVVFRADTLNSAWRMLQAMSGIGGIALPLPWQERLGAISDSLTATGIEFTHLPYLAGGQYTYLLLLFIIVRFLPNTQEILGAYQPVLDAERHGLQTPGARIFRWRPGSGWAVAVALIFVASLLSLHRQNAFFYFQF